MRRVRKTRKEETVTRRNGIVGMFVVLILAAVLLAAENPEAHRHAVEGGLQEEYKASN